MSGEVIVLRPTGPAPGRLDHRDDGAVESLAGIEIVAKLGGNAIAAILALRQALLDGSGLVRRSAAITMSTIADAATLPVGDDVPVATGWVFALGKRVDRTLAQVHHRLAVLDRRRRLPRDLWTGTALGLSVFVAICVISGHWLLGASILTARVTVSTMIGNQHDLPFESLGLRSDSGLRVITRCMAGHLGDAVIMLSTSWALMAAQRTVWGAVVTLATVVMFVATLFRVAALQVGVQMYRLLLERVMRGGVMVGGLLATALFQPTIPVRGVPLLALSTGGALLYGVAEVVRTVSRLVRHDMTNCEIPPQVRILVTRGDRGRAVALRCGFEPYTIEDARIA